MTKLSKQMILTITIFKQLGEAYRIMMMMFRPVMHMFGRKMFRR
jgi:hypothetical protein